MQSEFSNKTSRKLQESLIEQIEILSKPVPSLDVNTVSFIRLHALDVVNLCNDLISTQGIMNGHQ